MKKRPAYFYRWLEIRSFTGWMAALVFLIWATTSCSSVKPEVVVPSYIQVDTFSFQGAGPDSTGFPTQRISDVWLFANNQTLGVYSIPTGKIPVLASGNTNISILAGVFTDGVRKNRVYYPFYRSFDTQIMLEKEKTTRVRPYFRYTDEKKKPFQFYQDFESSDSGCIRGDNGTVGINRLGHNGLARYSSFGDYYAHLSTTNDNDVIEFSNNQYVPLVTNGNPVYLEFDYKSTCEIAVGVTALVGTTKQGSVADLILKPRNEWTKIYVSLSDETRLYNTESVFQRKPARFRFFLKTLIPPGSGNSLSLDNIRLIN